MSELISRMSEVKIPEDLISQVDMKGVVENFRTHFKRLDDFRKTRTDYENRGFWKKLGDAVTFDSTMEDAQLDAVETQANFSKAIGQLLVISIVQSQQLQQQQGMLSNQQATLQAQAKRIEQNGEALQHQQQSLKAQNESLKKLVDDYFELKGLTADRAKELIRIASEVRATRDGLLKSVGDTAESVRSEMATTKQNLSGQMNDLEAHVFGRLEEIVNQCAALEAGLAAQYAKIGEESEKIHGIQGEIEEHARRFKLAQRTWMEQFSGLEGSTNSLSSATESLGRDMEIHRVAVANVVEKQGLQEATIGAELAGLRTKLESSDAAFEAYRAHVGGRLWRLYIAFGVIAAGMVATAGYLALHGL